MKVYEILVASSNLLKCSIDIMYLLRGEIEITKLKALCYNSATYIEK